jgi:hypothetical protein
MNKKSKPLGVLFEDEKFRKEKELWTQQEAATRAATNPTDSAEDAAVLALWEGEVQELKGDRPTDGGGQVNIALPRFLALLRAAASPASTSLPVMNHFVSELRIIGTAGRKDQGANLRISIRITLLTSRWTTVQLLPDKFAISESLLVAPEVGMRQATHERHTHIQQAIQLIFVLIVASSTENQAFIGVRNGAHCLFGFHAGEYKIQLTGRCPYQTSRARGVIFNIPYAVLNSLEFVVPEKDCEIVATPSLAPKLVSEGTGATKLMCNVPPCSELSIQWSEKIEEQEAALEVQEVAEKEVIVTMEQFTLHSVSEGAIVC